MPSTIHLVTGGARSGKSGYAQRLCESICPNPIYLATSKVWDKDFENRVKRHQDDRGDHWTTIEETLHPSKHVEKMKGRAVLVDCLTLWLTNYFVEEGVFSVPKEEGEESKAKEGDYVAESSEKALTKIKEEFAKLTEPWNITFVFVTNEIGSGTHASSGWFNQHAADHAERVVHMVCGVPNVIKKPPTDARSPLALPSPAQRNEAQVLDKFLSCREIPMDEKGYFMMKLDHTKGMIVATFHSCIRNDKGEFFDLEGNQITCCGPNKTRPEPVKVWECRTAKEMTTEIFERWSHAKEVVSVGHAAYIGREAQKAEHCLYSGKNYQQD